MSLSRLSSLPLSRLSGTCVPPRVVTSKLRILPFRSGLGFLSTAAAQATVSLPDLRWQQTRGFLSSNYGQMAAAKAANSAPTEEKDVETHSVASIDDLAKIMPLYAMVARMRGRTSSIGAIRGHYKTIKGHSPSSSPDTPVRPSQSWLSLTLPFASHPELRSQYALFDSHVLRVGYILENLDSLAADIAYRHAGGGISTRDVAIVTAFLERMEFTTELRADADLTMEGCVTWVGKSSMEVVIDLSSSKVVTNADGTSSTEQVHHGQAVFLMVARDGTAGMSKAVAVPPLKPVTVHDFSRFESGVARRMRRHKMSEIALERKPPNEDEKYIIHNMFMEAQRVGPVLPVDQYVWMDDTSLSNTEIMQSQDRNIHNKMFGGYLMRMALELASANAWRFSGVKPVLTAVDDIHFVAPVPVGSVVQINSKAVFSSHLSSSVVIYVDVQVMDPSGKFMKDITNSFYFAFRVFNPNQPTRQILPRTYADAMKLLEGRRRLVSYAPHLSQ